MADPQLRRGLGFFAAASIIVCNVIGQGIFLKPRIILCNAGLPWLAVLVWIAAGALAMAGALTFAELGAMMPDAGGGYVYVRRGLGKLLGFASAWMLFTGTGGAALAVGSAIFANALSGSHIDVRWLAVAFVAIAVIGNCAAITANGIVMSAFSVLKVALAIGIGILAIAAGRGDWSHLVVSAASGSCIGVDAATRGGLAGFAAGMLGAMYSYQGWITITALAGEIKMPGRTIPRALVASMAVTIAVYVFANLGFFYAMTPHAIAAQPPNSSLALAILQRTLGAGAKALLTGALLLSAFGALYVSIATVSRLTYAMARDGAFFPMFGLVSALSRVPVRAVLLVGAWMSALALSGTFDIVSNLSTFLQWSAYALIAFSLFALRRSEPSLERPYRVWGYPFVPGLFILITFGVLASTIVSNPWGSAAAVGLVLAGVPLYYLSRLNAGADRANL